MTRLRLRILNHPGEMEAVENLQRRVWEGSETDVVPAHMLLAAAQTGGFVIAAFKSTTRTESRSRSEVDDPFVVSEPFEENETEVGEGSSQESVPAVDEPIGFVFGFPGLYFTPDGPRPMHYSHMLGVHPAHRGMGVGFALKRAQWQMSRHQGLDRVTWTYDPLLSRNAYLNITRLGAVSNTYKQNVYGTMRDDLNSGLPSDRLLVDWWINTKRVERRLSKRARLQLDLAHFIAAGAEILNPTTLDDDGFPIPPENSTMPDASDDLPADAPFVLLEIPADFQTMRQARVDLALHWRLWSRNVFERLFEAGYLITDFIYLPGSQARSFYVFSHGESTL